MHKKIWVSIGTVCFLASLGCGSNQEPSGSAGSGGGGAAGAPPECEGVGAAAGIPAPITWGPCGNPPSSGTVDCAALEVPIDYQNPSAGTYTLDLMRVPAAKPASRTGSVVIHVGGPGGSAIDLMKQYASILPPVMKPASDEKDLVAMDVRGVSQSSRADFMTDALIESLRAVDRTPDDDADWQALDAVYRAMADAALAKYPPEKLATWGSRDMIRDMVRLSAALGEDRLDYLGLSQGTLVGAALASACPSRVGHFVFDAAVSPAVDFLENRGRSSRALDQGLQRIAGECSKDPNCPFHPGETAAQIIDARHKLSDLLEAGVAVGGRKVAEADLFYATRAVLWGYQGQQARAEALWKALAAAEQPNNDWAPLLALGDAAWGRRADGTYDRFPYDRYWAIALNDFPCPTGWTLDDAKKAITDVATDSPELGIASMTETLICLHWPVLGPALTVQKTTAPPLLVIGGNLDVAAPVANASALVDALGNGSYLLTHEQPGHGALISNSCVRAAEIQFLVDGKEPNVTHCDAE